MARTTIDETVYLKLSRLSGLLGCNEREAIGYLVFLWRNSQEELLVELTGEQVLDCCHVWEECDDFRNRVIAALVKTKFIVPLGNRLYRVSGNERHVEALESYKRRAKKARESKNQGVISPRSVHNSVDSPVDSVVHRTDNSEHINSYHINSNQFNSKKEEEAQKKPQGTKKSVCGRKSPSPSFAVSSSKPEITPDEIIDMFNTTLAKVGSVQPCHGLGCTDMVTCANIITDFMPRRKQWADLFERVRGSPFLTGSNSKNWKVTLDWLIDYDKIQRVRSGKYDGSSNAVDEWKFE